MKTFKCNRCGGYFDNEQELKDEFVLFKANAQGVLNGDTVMDLCPRCHRDLRKFMKDEDTEAYLPMNGICDD